jgi:hypothetical protein
MQKGEEESQTHVTVVLGWDCGDLFTGTKDKDV